MAEFTFFKLTEKQLDLLSDVLRLNYANSALDRYTKAHDFEGVLMGSSSKDLIGVNFILSLIFIHKKDWKSFLCCADLFNVMRMPISAELKIFVINKKVEAKMNAVLTSKDNNEPATL